MNNRARLPRAAAGGSKGGCSTVSNSGAGKTAGGGMAGAATEAAAPETCAASPGSSPALESSISFSSNSKSAGLGVRFSGSICRKKRRPRSAFSLALARMRSVVETTSPVAPGSGLASEEEAGMSLPAADWTARVGNGSKLVAGVPAAGEVGVASDSPAAISLRRRNAGISELWSASTCAAVAAPSGGGA